MSMKKKDSLKIIVQESYAKPGSEEDKILRKQQLQAVSDILLDDKNSKQKRR